MGSKRPSLNSLITLLKRSFYILWQRCLDVEKAARLRERPSLAPAGQDFSSQWVGSTDCSGKATMPRELELVLQSTWQQSWSTWLPRSWSWLVMLPGTTRSLASSQGTSSSLSGTGRGGTGQGRTGQEGTRGYGGN